MLIFDAWELYTISQLKWSVNWYGLGYSNVFNECNKQEAAKKAFLKQHNYAAILILTADDS